VLWSALMQFTCSRADEEIRVLTAMVRTSARLQPTPADI